MDAESEPGASRERQTLMLIGSASEKPDLEAVRRIKRVLREVLGLPEEATVTVTQLACLEEDCAPLETVVGLLRPGAPQLQHKIHKATNALSAEDLLQVCEAWGHAVEIEVLKPLFKEH